MESRGLVGEVSNPFLLAYRRREGWIERWISRWREGGHMCRCDVRKFVNICNFGSIVINIFVITNIFML